MLTLRTTLMVGRFTDSRLNQTSGTGICSDANGHVFITGYVKGTSLKGYVFEFAHGGSSPISTLNVSGTSTAFDDWES